ncbi:MAG: hypothetical protein ACT4P1_12375 [Sporichthyaceae bacterium]
MHFGELTVFNQALAVGETNHLRLLAGRGMNTRTVEGATGLDPLPASQQLA